MTKNGEPLGDYEELAVRYEHVKQAYDKLLFEYEKLRRQVVGPKRERVPAPSSQPLLDDDIFRTLGELGVLPDSDEDAAAADEPVDDEALKEAKRDARQSEKQKQKQIPRRRDPSLENVPVERIVLEPAERLVPGGEHLVMIGEKVSSHFERRRASVVRVEVVRPVYAGPGGAAVGEPNDSSSSVVKGGADTDFSPDGDVVPRGAPLGRAPRPQQGRQIFVAEMPPRPVDKGLAGPGLLAYTLVSKYCDHLPWHRLSSILARDGLTVSRSVLCDWTEQSVALLSYITKAMWDDARANARYVIVDATGVLVQAKRECKRGSFYVGVVPGEHVLFRYVRKNDGDSVAALFKGFSGYVHADAASVYHELYRREDVVEVGCWAHARRGFFEAYTRDPERALIAIGYIGKLYETHRASRNKRGVIDGEKRARLARPVLAQLLAWVRRELRATKQGTPIHTALGYIKRQRRALLRFLDDSRLNLDTNLAEGALRREAKGRDNWLFCASDEGARWNSVVVTLIASCQMHGLEPWAYLRDVLTLLPVWDQTRALELSPKHWEATRARPATRDLLSRLRLIDYGDGDDAAPAHATAAVKPAE